jgi:hypothetical protein
MAARRPPAARRDPRRDREREVAEMTKRIGVLIIHGMGAQKPGFSAGLRDALTGTLANPPERVVWEEIYWAGVLEPRETDLWRVMRTAEEPDGAPIPLDWRSIREFVVHNFGDAIAYHRDQQASAYNDVHAVISRSIHDLNASLGDPGAPIVVMAHSLGSHMMSNYLWDRQHGAGTSPDPLEEIPTLAAMVTFGCNIPLFSLSYRVAKPINLPGPAITNPRVKAASRWLNFLDRDDVLGWPLRPLYAKDLGVLDEAQKGTVERMEDREINVGGAFTAWNPAAHGAYWTDGDFVAPVAGYLDRLFAAMDSILIESGP